MLRGRRRTPRNSRYNSAVFQELPRNILFALGGQFRGTLLKYSREALRQS